MAVSPDDEWLVSGSRDGTNVLITWTAPFGADEEAMASLTDEIAAAKAREDTVTVSLEMVMNSLGLVAERMQTIRLRVRL